MRGRLRAAVQVRQILAERHFRPCFPVRPLMGGGGKSALVDTDEPAMKLVSSTSFRFESQSLRMAPGEASACLSPAQAPPSRWGRPLRPSMPTAAGQGCRLKRGRQGQTARRTGRPQRATRRTLRTSSAEAASGRVPTLRGRGADVVVGPGRGHRGAGLAGSDSSARCRCPWAEFQVRRSGVGRAGARGVKDGA